jgi:hypothetical protein
MGIGGPKKGHGDPHDLNNNGQAISLSEQLRRRA